LKVFFCGKVFIVVKQKHDAGGVAVFDGGPLKIEAFVDRGVDEDCPFTGLLRDGGESLYEADKVPVGEGLLGKVVDLPLDLLFITLRRQGGEGDDAELHVPSLSAGRGEPLIAVHHHQFGLEQTAAVAHIQASRLNDIDNVSSYILGIKVKQILFPVIILKGRLVELDSIRYEAIRNRGHEYAIVCVEALKTIIVAEVRVLPM
jgi:hypothetical protein